jgi:hypothetical protein
MLGRLSIGLATRSVAGAFEGRDIGVGDDGVDHGDGLVAECVGPIESGRLPVSTSEVCSWRVRRAGKQVRGVLFDAEVADFINLCRHRHMLISLERS